MTLRNSGLSSQCCFNSGMCLVQVMQKRRRVDCRRSLGLRNEKFDGIKIIESRLEKPDIGKLIRVYQLVGLKSREREARRALTLGEF